MAQLFTNNAVSKLASGISDVATSLTLSTGTGSLFPSPTGGDYFLVTLYSLSGYSEINHEIIKVTARSGDVLTVTRSQESTTARTWATNTPVELRITAGTTNSLINEVTLSGTETLSNKTLTTPIITGTKEIRIAMSGNAVDLATGNYFTKTFTAGSVSVTVSNVPSSGTSGSFILEATNAGLATITWPTGTKWAGGTAPTLTSAGVDILGFYTHDGGATWRGMVLAKDSK